MNIEDKRWFRSADEDTMKALGVIEGDIPRENLVDYLRAIERASVPVTWDQARRVFVVRKDQG